MGDIRKGYMTLSLDLQPDGWSVACWHSTVDFWKEEIKDYPYAYTHMGDDCTWLIHCNMECSFKILRMAVEQADRICKEGERINAKRKIANL